MTVSNHVTAVDDPGMVATLIDAKDFASPSHLRWQMCAADRCFRVRWLGLGLGLGLGLATAASACALCCP